MKLTPIKLSERKDSVDLCGSDNWETPMGVWRDLKNILPATAWTSGPVWDPFFCTGRAKIYLEDLGFLVKHQDENFLEARKPDLCTWMITNPPFSRLEEMLPRMLQMDMPICTLLPSKVLEREWFNKLVANEDVMVVPTTLKRIPFIKDGRKGLPAKFECMWVIINGGLTLNSEDMTTDGDE